MDAIQKGWFSEMSTMWPGQAQSIQVEKILHQEKSQYQDILVFQSATYGKVLVLDGVIQLTERDEFSYQEMIMHTPICSHGKVEKVLIIGGGDGGCVREALRHSSVKEVHLCEIDNRVCEVSLQFFPEVAYGLKDPRVHVHYMDGALFLKQNPGVFDVVVVDSSDPVGPAETLFQKEFYQNASNALNDNGILATQAESVWLHLDLIANMVKFNKEIFPVVEYAFTSIPTYPSGVIGFFLCSKNKDHSSKKSVVAFDDPALRYYSTAIHQAAFVLPAFAAKKLQL